MKYKSIMLFLIIGIFIMMVGCSNSIENNDDSNAIIRELSPELQNQDIEKNQHISEINKEKLDPSIEEYQTPIPPFYSVTDECEPNKDNLPSQNEILMIHENMSYAEVINILGKPQRSMGSGALWYEWDLKDGKTLKLMFGIKNYTPEFSLENMYLIKIFND